MIDLPKSTIVNRKIPKQKCYENLMVSPALKRVFVEQIKSITWTNKIAASTTNLLEGKTVSEVEIFELQLTRPTLDVSVLRQIDKEIPYHIVFLLSFNDKYQLWIAYKEAALSGKNAFKVDMYYHTEWLPEKELPLVIEGLSIDQIYENFVRQISGDALKTTTGGESESLKESVERDKQIQLLQKQIDVLQMKICREKQLNRQMELNSELKRLKRELQELQ